MVKFALKNGQGARLDVKAVHNISRNRCRCDGANCAVIIGNVSSGTFQVGDEIVLVDNSGKKLLEDKVARLEISCRKHFEVSKDNRVGLLLEKHDPKDLLKLGISLHKVRATQSAHPYGP